MKYYIWRNNQQYGPYSLADLQRYLASGDILPNDMSRSEAMQQWIPVQQLVASAGSPNAPPPPDAQAPLTPAPTYTQSPFYTPQAAIPQAVPALVPDLHWGLLLLLTIITCGLFAWVWMFIQAAAVRRLDSRSNALIFYAVGLALSLGSGIFRSSGMWYGHTTGSGALISIAATALVIIGHFNIRSSLEQYFTRSEPIGLALSSVLTFFFGPIYFQYHFNRINRWRRTGILS